MGDLSEIISFIESIDLTKLHFSATITHFHILGMTWFRLE